MVGKTPFSWGLPVQGPSSGVRSLEKPVASRQDFTASGLKVLLGHLVPALIALVAIGGATRVMQAGLACPDWPLCYGSLIPGRQMNLQVFLEWFHRLDAFVVGMALLVLGATSLVQRRQLPRWFPWMAALALALVVVQAALGASTVIGLLAAPTVTAHLLTALILVLLISGMHQAWLAHVHVPSSDRSSSTTAVPLPTWWFLVLAFASLALFSQCAIGGGMGSHWAASLCLEEGRVCRWLQLHRLAAWPALVSLAVLAPISLALPPTTSPIRPLAWAAALLVPVQIALGVITLRLQLAQPPVTVAHQVIAAVLVALLGALWGRSLARPNPAPTLAVSQIGRAHV